MTKWFGTRRRLAASAASMIALSGCASGRAPAQRPVFLLVHGSFHGGWCWNRIVPMLEAAGASVVAPDLAGMGADDTPMSAITFERWMADLCALVDAAPGPVIAVGHSRGGGVITGLAERRAERLAACVYVTAMMPQPGETITQCWQRASVVPTALTADSVIVTDDGLAVAWSPQADARRVFYNRCGDEDVAFALERLCPDPLAPNEVPVSSRLAGDRGVPQFYIECMDDNALPLAMQRAMWRDMSIAGVFTLDCDHSPFFSAREELVRCLVTLARRLP